MSYALIAAVGKGTNARTDGQGTAGVAGGVGFGLKFNNDGNLRLLVENTGVGSPVLNVETSGTLASKVVPDEVITVPAGQTFTSRTFPRNPFNQGGEPAVVYMNMTGGDEADLKITVI